MSSITREDLPNNRVRVTIDELDVDVEVELDDEGRVCLSARFPKAITMRARLLRADARALGERLLAAAGREERSR